MVTVGRGAAGSAFFDDGVHGAVVVGLFDAFLAFFEFVNGFGFFFAGGGGRGVGGGFGGDVVGVGGVFVLVGGVFGRGGSRVFRRPLGEDFGFDGGGRGVVRAAVDGEAEDDAGGGDHGRRADEAAAVFAFDLFVFVERIESFVCHFVSRSAFYPAAWWPVGLSVIVMTSATVWKEPKAAILSFSPLSAKAAR